RGPRMSVSVTVGDGQVTPLAGFPKKAGRSLPANALTVASGPSGAPALIVTTLTTVPPEVRGNGASIASTSADVYAWGVDGKPALRGGSADGRIIADAGAGEGFLSGVTVADLNADGVVELLMTASGTGTSFRAYTFSDANADSSADQVFTLPLAGLPAASPITTETFCVVAGSRGRVHWTTKQGTLHESELVLLDSTASVAGVSRYPSIHAVLVTGTDGTVALRAPIYPNGRVVIDRTLSLGRPIAGPATSASSGTTVQVAVATTDGRVYLLDGYLHTVPGFPVQAGNAMTDPPVLADVNGDGLRDVVAFADSRVYVWNASGVLLDNFPVSLPSGDTLLSSPVVADVNGDGLPDILGGTKHGLVVAYDRTGKSVPGFPLVAGTGRQSVAVLTTTDSIIVAAASGDDGSVSAWLTGKTSLPLKADRYPWPQYQRDQERAGLDTTNTIGTPLADAFFPSSRAYNWPNPAYDGKTMIRYYVRESATVQITVYDMAGDLVASLNGPGVGGMDNEVVWDLAGVQSGVYFAHIDAAGQSGSGSAIVKIAVVK
ncbi:MAG TPA: FG-GAP-like repeat-containing protein, partial [Bacteroidota bacterium]|nr:FG-GAP-like repeat-containing protein [Bacteroidota bacterium]